ncbi:MAG: sugar phosphate nucleotidyltransferase [Candidatus Peribacteraceae bacterium]|jgi:glucose-1-phosphate thymidylyltransferase
MKGVLICGGTGSRLRPLTDILNKSLLPVYHQPLILYPLQVLLDANIKEIAVVTGTEHMDQMTAFLGSGSRFNCEFSYKVQEKPGGIAQALGLAEDFIEGDSVCAILGDNIFFDDLSSSIQNFDTGGHIFLKEVDDPERFGVVEIEGDHVVSIEEKPQNPKSNFAHTGCYLYDNRCFEVIRNLQPSLRGELEISDVSQWYLKQGEIKATILQDKWIDAGTFESLFKAAEAVRTRRLYAMKKAKLAAKHAVETPV